VHVIEINNGELMQSLTDQLAELGVDRGAIVSLIGGVDSFTISTMPAADATKDIITDYDLPAEMSGTGEVVDGKPHVHAVMAVEGDRAISGHLHAAHVGTWFARVYVAPTSE
jgi:predicted DNA-binding protein with PD1-like motif